LRAASPATSKPFPWRKAAGSSSGCRPRNIPAVGRVDLRGLLEGRGDDLELWARTINPQFVRVLRTIDFDRTWERAEGAHLWDAKGDRYLDMLGGFGMLNVGRNNPRVRDALVQALELDLPGAVQLGATALPGLL